MKTWVKVIIIIVSICIILSIITFLQKVYKIADFIGIMRKDNFDYDLGIIKHRNITVKNFLSNNTINNSFNYDSANSN